MWQKSADRVLEIVLVGDNFKKLAILVTNIHFLHEHRHQYSKDVIMIEILSPKSNFCHQI